MSPVLVTGGSGYLGTRLIAVLLRDGRAGPHDGALPDERGRRPYRGAPWWCRRHWPGGRRRRAHQRRGLGGRSSGL